jgi:hypothetical protein
VLINFFLQIVQLVERHRLNVRKCAFLQGDTDGAGHTGPGGTQSAGSRTMCHSFSPTKAWAGCRESTLSVISRLLLLIQGRHWARCWWRRSPRRRSKCSVNCRTVPLQYCAPQVGHSALGGLRSLRPLCENAHPEHLPGTQGGQDPGPHTAHRL